MLNWFIVLFRSTISFCLSDFPGDSDGKASCLQCGRPGFNPWVEKIPWRRKWQPTPVFLPGEFHKQRSLVGYSPWDLKVSDTTFGRKVMIQLGKKQWLHIGWEKREV